MIKTVHLWRDPNNHERFVADPIVTFREGDIMRMVHHLETKEEHDRRMAMEISMRQKVLNERYLLEGENEEMMYRRVANAIGDTEDDKWKFFEVMKDGKFLPNTPTLVNAGTPKKGGFSACYVLGIEDNLESISKAFNDCMMVHRYYGGTGFNFSKIRPKGSEIESTQGKACGPIKVMIAMNEIVDMISQGGKREGANMGCLEYDHPDILDFIEISGDKGRLGHFNTSVVVDREFFNTLSKDGDVRCLHPATDLIRTIPAKVIWDAICERAWKTGSPGLIFQDAIDAGNTVPGLGYMTCTNPCGEQPLRENESCNLGSINLSKFVRTDGIRKDFDTEEFGIVIRIAVRFLDAIIDKNFYPTEQIKQETLLTRKIGLGVMGWADTLILMGYRWRSNEALQLAERLGEILREEAREESAKLAAEKGVFPAFKESIFDGGLLQRNATVTTIAPTGTLSFLAGCSSGIEPNYDWVVTRKTEQGTELIYHPLWKMVEGSVLMGDTALKIEPEWHLKHVLAWQKNIDNAVSKTVNLPKEATVDDVSNTYKMAYRLGLKGVTIYRNGSRDEQALRTEEATVPPQREAVTSPIRNVERYPAHVYKMNSGCGFCWVIVAERNEEMKNLEHVFVLTDGGCSANNESTGRGISLMLQKGVPVDDICRFLGKVKCFNAMKNPNSQGKSCSDIIGQCIKMEHDDYITIRTIPPARIINEGEPLVETNKCPECGAKLNFESGCGSGTCKVCGWSGCH